MKTAKGSKLAVLRAVPRLSAQELNNIRPLTWVEIQWNDAPNEVALVLKKAPDRSFDIMLRAKRGKKETWITDNIERSQIVSILGTFADEDIPKLA